MGQSEITKCRHIGLWRLDRGLKSCKFSTPYCREHCYNRKFYKRTPIAMTEKDRRNEDYWSTLTGQGVRDFLAKRKYPVKRFRLASRGELLTSMSDVQRVASILKHNPSTQFSLPTRAWKDPEIWNAVRNLPHKNLRLIASVDPSTSQNELDMLHKSGVSTMFFGNDSEHPFADTGKVVKCDKTWRHAYGHCVICTGGCFSKKQRHIWLKKH